MSNRFPFLGAALFFMCGLVGQGFCTSFCHQKSINRINLDSMYTMHAPDFHLREGALKEEYEKQARKEKEEKERREAERKRKEEEKKKEEERKKLKFPL